MPGKKDKAQLTFWGIPKFPEDVKNKFMGTAKIRGQEWKEVLINLMRTYITGRKPM